MNNMQEQITSLKTEADTLNKAIVEKETVMSGVRGNIGRMKRTTTAMKDNDIDIIVVASIVENDKEYTKLSDLMTDIITQQETALDGFNTALVADKDRLKKLDKAIDTLEALSI